MTLALKRIVWSDGTSRPDDYNVILWYALTNNILQGHRLLAAAQVA